jgi:hypothetical protein
MRGESRNRVAKLVIACFVVLIACCVTYGQDVTSNYLPGTDFSKYHTYKWVTVGPNGVGELSRRCSVLAASL